MPIVGTGKKARHFAYTKAGEKAARAESKRTGKPMKMAGSKMKKRGNVMVGTFYD